VRILAEESFNQALSLDPYFAPAYSGLSLLARANFDFAAADRYLQRALQVDPGAAGTLGTAASLMRTFGRFDNSIDLASRSITLDPVQPFAYSNLGYSLYYAGFLDEAKSSFGKTLSLGPEMLRAHFYLERILLAQAKLPEALQQIQQEPDRMNRYAGMAMVYFSMDDRESSNQAVDDLITGWSDRATFQIAEVHAFRDEPGPAFEWLEKAYDTQDGGLAVFLGNPVFEGLKSDSRYLPFVEKLGLLPYLQEME
jgi:serine/threonine-protein kinase